MIDVVVLLVGILFWWLGCKYMNYIRENHITDIRIIRIGYALKAISVLLAFVAGYGVENL